jgi:hypothetical protein
MRCTTTYYYTDITRTAESHFWPVFLLSLSLSCRVCSAVCVRVIIHRCRLQPSHLIIFFLLIMGESWKTTSHANTDQIARAFPPTTILYLYPVFCFSFVFSFFVWCLLLFFLSHFAFLHLSSDFHVVFAPFRLTISLRYRAELSPSGYDPPCLFSFP